MHLPKTTVSFILYFFREQWFKFSIFALTAILWALNDSIFPYFLKRIVNVLSSYQGPREQVYVTIKGLLFLLLLFWIISEVCNRAQGIMQIYTYPRFRASIRSKVYDYVKSHSHEYFSSQFAGNIAKKLGDLPTSCQTVLEIVFFNFTPAGTGAVIVLIMMWHTNPIFAIILLAWLVLHFSLTFLFLRYGNKLWEIHSEAAATLGGKIVDSLTNILNVRLFAHSHYEAEHLKQFQNIEIAKAQKAMWIFEIMRCGLGINGLFLIFSMIFTLIHGWVHHWVTLGDFTQVSMQSFWLLGWIWYMSFQLMTVAREAGTISNALTLIKEPHDIIDQPHAPIIKIQRGEIQFENVCFSYRKNTAVFDNLNVTIPAAQKVGLVGFSGSGKSTFVNLILRFYDLQSGKIIIDGQNIADVTQESLRSQVAMIPQDPALFHRSLMDNIRYGNLTASDDEVTQASILAHCHEFIEKLEEGYQSLVGERGVKLSGGQRQRIAIARAILKNAPILILDEATSSLDSVTEKLIQTSLQTLMKNRTTIVIAHRLSTLMNMDRILVFHKGRIIEQGSQQDLLRNDGHFAMLWKMQADGFLPEDEDA